MSLFEKTFPLMYYINLDSRPDRKELAEKEFKKLGISPVRMEGQIIDKFTDPYINKTIGCFRSHVLCLHEAYCINKNVFIFEDDVKFSHTGDGETFDLLEKAVEELVKRDWDMFYISANILKPFKQVSPHLAKLEHGQSTVAYGVNAKFLSRLSNYFFNQDGDFRYPIIDVIYANSVIPENNCYITVPMLATQRNGFSDIERQDVEYEGYLQARYDKHFVRMEDEK